MDGVNVAVLPVAPPGIQVYVPAQPDALNVAGDPAHTNGVLDVTEGTHAVMHETLTVVEAAEMYDQPEVYAVHSMVYMPHPQYCITTAVLPGIAVYDAEGPFTVQL